MSCQWLVNILQELSKTSRSFRNSEERHRFVYNDGGLQLLTRIWSVFKCNEKMMCILADILVNLTLDTGHHSLLVSGGFLHMLAVWIKSLNRELRSKGMS